MHVVSIYLHIYVCDDFIVCIIAFLLYIWSSGVAGLFIKPLVTGFGRVN